MATLFRTLKRASALLAALAVGASFAASNIVEYSFDAAGNITQIKRQAAAGFAITSFDPTSGVVGTAVTIYGTGFSATPANNTVKFNGTTATVGASDTGSISTTVPSGATTGRITVTVGGNTATSAQDFIVTVPGIPTVTSFTPSSGVSGTSIAVTGTNFDPAASATTVKLNGVTATASVASATSLSFSVPGAAASGKITATTAGGTGTSATDFLVPPSGIDAADVISMVRIAAGGAAANVAVGTAGKHGLVLFDANVDTFYTLQLGQYAVTPSTSSIPYKIIKPDNTVLATGFVGNTQYRPTIHLPKLAAAGTYSLLLSPGSATLNTNVKLVADPIVVVDGSAASIALDTPSQSARVVFDAAANQRVGLGITGFTLAPDNGSGSSFKAYKPDGTQLGGDVAYCYSATGPNPQGNCDGEIVATVAGTYTLIAEVVWGSAGTFGLQLSNEATGTLTADSGADVTLARVGQDARYTFNASAGDSIALALSGIVTQPQAQPFYTVVYKPDASVFVQTSVTPPAGGYLEMGSVATSGTYTVALDPTFGAYGTARLTLKQGAVLATTGAATAFAPSTIAEAARFRFSATAGQNLVVAVTDLVNVVGGTSGSSLFVYAPDRSQIGSTVTCTPTVASGRCKATLTNLPATGTYSAVIVPPSGVKITGNAILSSDITGTLAAGTPQAIAATRDGQNARFTFSGTTGDSTAVKLYGVTTTPASQNVNLKIYKPDGNLLGSTTASSSGAGIVNLGSLPSTGTYTVLVEPFYGTTWQGTLALDPGTLMTLDGTTATLASAAGEPVRYRFSATTGQRVEWGVAGLTYASASSNTTSMYVYSPNGSYLTNQNCATAGAGACDLFYAPMPSTGVYSVVFTPPAASAITGGTFAISTPLAGTFVIGNPAQTVAITRPGQTARYTFSGTAAQLLRINWSGTTVSGGASVTVSVLKPDGSILSLGSFANNATGGFDIASLPTTGTYTVFIDPASAATMSAPLSLVTR